jgi:hypothetical protein
VGCGGATSTEDDDGAATKVVVAEDGLGSKNCAGTVFLCAGLEVVDAGGTKPSETHCANTQLVQVERRAMGEVVTYNSCSNRDDLCGVLNLGHPFDDGLGACLVVPEGMAMAVLLVRLRSDQRSQQWDETSAGFHDVGMNDGFARLEETKVVFVVYVLRRSSETMNVIVGRAILVMLGGCYV